MSGLYDQRIDKITSNGKIVVSTWPNSNPPGILVRYRDPRSHLGIDVVKADQETFPCTFHFDVYQGPARIGGGVATAESASSVLLVLLRQDRYYFNQRIRLFDLPVYAQMKNSWGFGRKLPNRHQRHGKPNHSFFEYQVTDVPTVKEFLAKYYKTDRYTGQGPEYAGCLLRSHQRDFEQYGYDIISHHDSKTGEVVAVFDQAIVDLADSLGCQIGFWTVEQMRAMKAKKARKGNGS